MVSMTPVPDSIIDLAKEENGWRVDPLVPVHQPYIFPPEIAEYIRHT